MIAPDLILTNAKIVTADREFTIAEALAVSRGVIVAVGARAEVEALAGAGTKTVDLHGKCVVPGQIDSYQHFITAGIDMIGDRGAVELITKTSIDEILSAIKSRVDSTPAGQWVEAGCMYRGALTDGRWPNRWDLDQIAPDHPVYIRQGGRPIIANSHALRLAGIGRDTPDPIGPEGIIGRDADGEPTGQLIGGAADLARERWSQLVGGPAWEWDFLHFDREALVDAALAQQRVNLACGITTVRDDATYPAEIRAWVEARRRGLLRNRLGVLVAVPERHLWAKEDRDRFFGSYFEPWEMGGDLLWIAGVSIGYNLEGWMQIDEPRLREMILESVARGWTVAIPPSIGVSESVGEVLSILETAAEADPAGFVERRHTLTHPHGLRRPEDIERAKKLGLMVNPNPLLSYYAAERSLRMHRQIEATGFHQGIVPDAWEQAVGMWAPRTRDWFEASLVVSGGSNIPAATYDPERPFLGQYSALTNGTLAGVLLPDQAITREQMVRMYTSNAAYALMREDRIGSLEPGKYADLAVLDRDVLTCPDGEIAELKVLETYFEGELAHERG
ncbi:amidohydrolase [Sciscionella marina]|uniref:amidohydrolase n=1 Tax=Sciscionella marina TaxID=508770 RepID=UPI00036DD0DB|nr:amidohydrolase [Sciscionella marina]